MTALRRGAVWVLVLIAALVVAGVAYQLIGQAVDARAHPPRGELVPVDGGRMHLYCVGEGSPTVVFDAGGGDSSLVWAGIQEEVARDVRSCSFDRAGFGWSDAFADVPHGIDTYVDLQERLLAAGGVPAPYLLVGHSLGGLNAQAFAARNPDDVAGLVLVDSAHRELFEEVPQLVQSEVGFVRSMRLLSRLGVVRAAFAAGLVDPLEGLDVDHQIRAAYHAQLARGRHWDSVERMGAGLAEDLSRERALNVPRDLPAVVLTHGVPDMFEGLDVDPRHVEAVWQGLQADLAERFEMAELVVVEESGHMIPLEDPGAVVRAVRIVLDAVAAGD